MNWEALASIGSVAAVLAVLLLVPGLISARRLARRDRRFDTRVTRFGLLFFGSEILLVFLGLALLPGLLRDSWVEHAVGPGVPLVAYIVLVLSAFYLLGNALERRGFRGLVKGASSRGADS